MSLERRNCIAHDQDMSELPTKYQLTYFDRYSKDGCMIECRAEHSYQKCGCLPYYYPQFENEGNCNLTALMCLANMSGKI